MKAKLISLLLLCTAACTFQVNVLDTPAPPQPTSPAIVPPPATATPIVGDVTSATPSPISTSTATNTSQPGQAIDPGASAAPIQFGPNGTYVDLLDSLPAGTSKTYSVSAMKGQVMSVSIHQNEDAEWTNITLRIIGADKTLLCAGDCGFWRGVLPETEEYFVTVTPASDAADFTLRVAINPPGAETQSFHYENKYGNASLSYTDMFAPAFFPGGQVTKIQPELVLQLIDTDSYAKTNLLEAYFLFGSSTDPQLVSTCAEPASLDGPEQVVGDVTVNGITFTRSESTGAGAGNLYETTFYRTAYNGTCYEITYFIHSGNIGNYTPGSVKEFDHAALLQKFEKILFTLALK